MLQTQTRIDRRKLKKVMRKVGTKTALAGYLGITRPTLLRYLGGLEPSSKAMTENINLRLDQLLNGKGNDHGRR